MNEHQTTGPGPHKYNYKATKRRIRKADQGHSVVLMESWDKFAIQGFTRRKAITCQCGKRMTGYGDRAYYTYTAHLKREGVL